MDDRTETNEPRSDATRGRDPSAVRRLFDRAVPLSPDDRERLLVTCTAAEIVVTEVRELLALAPVENRVDPWRDDPRIGQVRTGTRGRWRLDRVIGEGGAGRVYRATEFDRGLLAAVKIIDRTRATPERLARVADELRALESIDHAGIVRVLDADLGDTEPSGEPWIAMELVEGARTVTEHALNLPSARPPEGIEGLLDLIESAMEIVASVHDAGVVHRDLKPSNLLVGADGRLRLIDFGVARLLGVHAEGPTLSIDRTREGDLVGTPAYMAPEQVDPTLGPISTATDVHALGVLAYRLLTGRLPYAIGESLLSAAQAIRFVPPRDLRSLAPEVGDSVATVVERCLAKTPSERPENAGVALEMLRAARRHDDHIDSHHTGHATGGGHGLRVAVVAMTVVITTAVAIVAATAFRSGGADRNNLDPNINQAVRRSPGAGDTEMKFRPYLGAVVGGAMVSGSVCAQDAVQWRVEDGGNGHWYRVDPTAGHATGDALREHALALGADLASITSVGEDEFVESLASLATSGSAIFGGFEVSPGSFVWLDGSSFEYANWCCDQPNTSDEYDYIGYYQIGGSFPGWSDIAYADGTVTHAIVEWSADCNSDGIVDYGQILDGTFTDDDGNGVPDCCEDGVPCDSAAVQWAVEDGGNGHWYEPVPFNGVVMSWEDSQTEAARRGGYLATLTTSAETAGLFDAMGSSNISAVWIGLRQDFQSPEYAEPSGGWIWVTGETLDWTNWDANEPNNSTNNEFGGEHWATLRISFGTPGRWNDYVPDYAGMAPGGYLIEWSDDCNDDGIVDYGQILDGTLLDTDQDGVPDDCQTPPCVGDITNNGQVDAADLGILLAVWNTAGKSNPEADINGDGAVDAADLGLLLGNWGPCPE